MKNERICPSCAAGRCGGCDGKAHNPELHPKTECECPNRLAWC